MFTNTHSISFELSNICNLSAAHRECPLHCAKEKTVLSSDAILRAISDLNEHRWRGRVGWNVYNEPLIDPRLFWLIAETGEILLKGGESMGDSVDLEQFVLTNGFYLNQTIIDELFSVGCRHLEMSAYSKAELDRAGEFKIPEGMKFNVNFRVLDNRLSVYDRDPIPTTTPCNAPLGEIVVKCDGSVVLCCLDWDQRHVFGNINYEPLSEIVGNGRMRAVQIELQKGNRSAAMCQRCGWSR